MAKRRVQPDCKSWKPAWHPGANHASWSRPGLGIASHPFTLSTLSAIPVGGGQTVSAGLVSWRIQARQSEWTASFVPFQRLDWPGAAEPISRLFRSSTPAWASPTLPCCELHIHCFPRSPSDLTLRRPLSCRFHTFVSCPTVAHSLRQHSTYTFASYTPRAGFHVPYFHSLAPWKTNLTDVAVQYPRHYSPSLSLLSILQIANSPPTHYCQLIPPDWTASRFQPPNYYQFTISTCSALSVLSNPCAYTPASSRPIVMYSR
jgi:hypothetical protein